MTSNDDTRYSGLRDLSRGGRDVAKFYDDWAEEYDRTLARWRYQAPEQTAARLRERLDPDSVVLDAGCGTGLSGQALVDAGFQVIDGIDVSQRSLDVAAKRGVYRSLTRVNMQQLPLPIEDGSYDGLVCVGVMTYLPESAETMREFCRVVKPNGAIVVTQRDDIMQERDFAAVLEGLQKDQWLRDLEISEPSPYLPENEEFSDEVMVQYIACQVV